MLLRGRVAGGAVSIQDYEALSTELKEQIIAFDRTIQVPRQLVSVRPGLDPLLTSRVGELLAGLDRTEKGKRLLEGLKNTKKFDDLPPDSEMSLSELKKLTQLVSDE